MIYAFPVVTDELPRNYLERAHKGKRGYAGRREARAVARKTDPGCHEYLCEVCGLWHVGHRR